MDINQTLENLRVSYQASKLDISDCDADPIIQFDHWLQHAIETKCDEPNAFTLSTVINGQPRGRVVLLKGVHENQLVFYTNYNSSKGQEILLNDKVAMTFLWLPLQRQIRVEGIVTKVPAKLSDEYFHKRPRGSQLGAIASPQSKRVETRSDLEKMFKDTEVKFANEETLPRPAHWGGYGVTPTYVEFWQGRNNRMHDRICYEKKNSAWEKFRLAP